MNTLSFDDTFRVAMSLLTKMQRGEITREQAARAWEKRSVDENISRAFKITFRVWRWRVYRIRGGWEWGWLGQGWNVLRLGKVRVWL